MIRFMRLGEYLWDTQCIPDQKILKAICISILYLSRNTMKNI